MCGQRCTTGLAGWDATVWHAVRQAAGDEPACYSMAQLDVTCVNGEEHKQPNYSQHTAQAGTAQSRAAHPGVVQQDTAWQRLWISIL